MKAILCVALFFVCQANVVNAAAKAQQQDYFHRSAVILQYHNVSTETPDITSVTPQQFVQHLDWLAKHQFDILALPDLLDTLTRDKPFKHTHNVAITFDDAHISVCTEAWPILSARKIPFTLFINTDAIERNFVSQCTWAQLKTMQQSGLMTVANHGHTHLHMVRGFERDSFKEWRSQMKQEILLAENLLQKHLNIKTDLFAYPYGEYNEALSALVTELGYTGFGQHSGAIAANSDFSALPRFPASGRFANLDTLSVKLNSLAFPGKVLPLHTNPVAISGSDNPPKLQLSPNRKMNAISCFDASTGEPITLKKQAKSFIVQHSKPLNEGRQRYNCTSISEDPARFYWTSHQWLMQ